MARLKPSRRAIAVVAALVLAGVATLALISYVNDARNQALADVEQVEVLVAKDTIAAGTTVQEATSEGLIDRETLPRKLVAEEAVRSLEEVEGQETATTIIAGEPLLRPRFVEPGESGTTIDIPDGYEAMSVELTVPSGGAGFVENGDTVSVIASVDRPGATGDQEQQAEASAGNDPFVKYLLHDVEVLSIGQRVTTDENGDEEDDGSVERSQERVLATVAVTPAQAEKLTFATLHGDLYLTLVPDEHEPSDTPGRHLRNLFQE